MVSSIRTIDADIHFVIYCMHDVSYSIYLNCFVTPLYSIYVHSGGGFGYIFGPLHFQYIMAMHVHLINAIFIDDQNDKMMQMCCNNHYTSHQLTKLNKVYHGNQ